MKQSFAMLTKCLFSLALAGIITITWGGITVMGDEPMNIEAKVTAVTQTEDASAHTSLTNPKTADEKTTFMVAFIGLVISSIGIAVTEKRNKKKNNDKDR